MRIIETHFYFKNSKKFIAGELTVTQFEMFVRDPVEAIGKILLEFNKKMPKLDEQEVESFTRWLFSWSQNPKNRRGKAQKPPENNDFHVTKGMFLHYFHQPYTVFDILPMREFVAMLEDLPIIIGQKEYDQHRRNKHIDSEALEELRRMI